MGGAEDAMGRLPWLGFTDVPGERPLCHLAEIGGSVLVGIGCAGRRGPSYPVPFDLLGMLVGAELVRQDVGATRINILIADAHAIVAYPGKAIEVHLAAQLRAAIVTAALHILGVPFEVVFASQLEGDPLYKQIFHEAQTRDASGADYFPREATDIEFFRRARNARAKLGWAIPSGKFDERAFDKVYVQTFPEGRGVYFYYIGPGQRLDPQRPNGVPYLDDDPAYRILLATDEDVPRKLNGSSQNRRQAVISHSTDIITAWEWLTRPVPGASTIDKIRELIKLVTRGVDAKVLRN
jgi:hypothetical protein